LPRLVDFVRGSDASRVPGAWQEDAIQNITGNITNMGSAYNSLPVASGALTMTSPRTRGFVGGGTSGNKLTIGIDASAVVRTDNETHPKSVSMLYCVKAFDAPINQSMIDITELANEVAGKQNILKHAILNETQAYNVDGGTFTAGGWRTRTLNTIDVDQIGLTLSGNQLTVPAGKYKFKANCPAYNVNRHFSRLYNITDAVEIKLSQTAFSNNTYGTYTNAILECYFEISSSKIFELQHYCTTTQANNGFGLSTTVNNYNSIYTTVEIEKVG